MPSYCLAIKSDYICNRIGASFSNMKNTTSISSKKKRISKGDRLNWIPLKDIQTVRLKECSASSRRLSKVDLSRINRNVTSFLIP